MSAERNEAAIRRIEAGLARIARACERESNSQHAQPANPGREHVARAIARIDDIIARIDR
jgi:hypothetical protein